MARLVMKGGGVADEDQKKLCFVIGPIGDQSTPNRTHADWLLRGIIRPVFAEHYPEFKVERADDISAPGSISTQIINRIHSAELVIADMSKQNANAFYEMGIRHMVRKPTIHMFLRGEVIPFDVKPFRAIEFALDEHNDLETAKKLLKAVIDETLKMKLEDVENPITQARGREKFKDSASEPEQILLAQIEQLTRRFDFMEMEIRREKTPQGAIVTPGTLAALGSIFNVDRSGPMKRTDITNAGRVLQGSNIAKALRGSGAIPDVDDVD